MWTFVLNANGTIKQVSCATGHVNQSKTNDHTQAIIVSSNCVYCGLKHTDSVIHLEKGLQFQMASTYKKDRYMKGIHPTYPPSTKRSSR